MRIFELLQLFSSLVSLVKAAVFQGSTQAADVIKLFPGLDLFGVEWQSQRLGACNS